MELRSLPDLEPGSVALCFGETSSLAGGKHRLDGRRRLYCDIVDEKSVAVLPSIQVRVHAPTWKDGCQSTVLLVLPEREGKENSPR